MSSISFNISVVRLQLREACKGREKRDDESQKRKNANNWIVDWKGGDLSDASIENRRNRWIKDKCHGTLQQMDFVAGVLEYMTVLERLKDQVSSVLSARRRRSLTAPFLFSQAVPHRRFPSMVPSSVLPLLRNCSSAAKASLPILLHFS